MDEEIGLRERKRLRTRAELIRVAQELFQANGYERTTLEEICREVMISVPTFFTYFKSKAEIALAWDHDWFERVRRQLDDPARARDTIDIWREHVMKGVNNAIRDVDGFLHTRRMQQSADVLVRARLSLLQNYYDTLTRSLAADLGTDVDDLQVDLVATMLTFGNNNTINWWLERDGSSADEFATRAVAVVDIAASWFEALRASSESSSTPLSRTSDKRSRRQSPPTPPRK